jgi:ankyrin repeat protein
MMAIGLAAREGDADMVEYLLNKGTDMYRSRVLFHAASCKHSDAVLRLLLEKKAIDVNMPDMNGYTPIFSAISAYSLTNVKLLIEKGIDVSQHSPRGLTVLEHAWACWGEVECVSGEEISEERRQDADNAKGIIELLGGFDRPEKKFYI